MIAAFFIGDFECGHSKYISVKYGLDRADDIGLRNSHIYVDLLAEPMCCQLAKINNMTKKFKIGKYAFVINKKIGGTQKKKIKVKKDRERLITWFGKLIEYTPFWLIGILMFLLIFGSAWAYCQPGMIKSSNVDVELGFPDALYFSVITFTSLGYGDFVPIGFAKILAASEVFFGLILVAISVGKLASERQSALILLVYTGQQQERIKGFEESLLALNQEILEAKDASNFEALMVISEKTLGFCSVVRSYLVLHAIQGDIARFGNDNSLLKLYRSFYKVQTTAYNVLKAYGMPDKTYTMYENIIGVLAGVARRMIKYHKKKSKAIGSLTNIEGFSRTLTNWKNDLAAGKVRVAPSMVPPDELLQKVLILLEHGDWSNDRHKEIATQLKISNKLATKCIDLLIELKKYEPKIDD